MEHIDFLKKQKQTKIYCLPLLTQIFAQRCWLMHLPHTGGSHAEVCPKKTGTSKKFENVLIESLNIIAKEIFFQQRRRLLACNFTKKRVDLLF